MSCSAELSMNKVYNLGAWIYYVVLRNTNLSLFCGVIVPSSSKKGGSMSSTKFVCSVNVPQSSILLLLCIVVLRPR